MTSRRSVLGFALLAGLAAPALSGCSGFAPLYGNAATVAGLSAIDVQPPPGRTGFLLRESLDDALGRNPTASPLYRLTFTLEELRNPRGLGADNAASRYELSLKVTYELTEIAGSKPLTAGTADVIITYGAIDAPYAGIAAQNAGQERAAAEAAQRIRADLAEYFTGRPSS